MTKQFLLKLLKNESFIAIALIFLTTLLTYGVHIPRLGYYYDDWYVLWSGAARGADSLISLFSTDRPFMGVIYSYLYRLMGDQLVLWHLYALLWRFVGAMAFFWILRLVWPGQKYITTLMAVLFVIYPGFLSQPDALTKQNHLFGFGTALLSIAFMLQSLKIKNRIWKILYLLISIILTANYLFIYEYMIGLEGMRLALLAFTLFQDGFKKTRTFLTEILKNWWPYPPIMAAFLYWRLFIFDSSRSATNADKLVFNYRSDLVNMSVRLIFESIKDFLDTAFFAWFVQPFHLFATAEYTDLVVAFLIAGIVIGLVWLYTSQFKKLWETGSDEANTPALVKNFIWIGAFAILCATVPVILSAREFNPTDSYKSYGLHPIGGVILLIAGFVLMLQPKYRKLILLALVGISVATQSLNASNWEKYWDYQRETWWQLTWRAPDIRNNTLLMTYFSVDFALQQDYETWGPVNLIYRPEPFEYPQIQAEVLNQDTAFSVLQQEVIDKYMRDAWLHRDFSKLLLISLPSKNSCVHVIDGILPVYSEYESLLVERVGGRSLIKRITAEGESPIPPASIFGAEPAHEWCYYYQKGSLARQRGDWDEVSRLYDETVAQKLKASDKSELFPFIEGLVNSGRLDEASALFEAEIKERDKLSYKICEALSRDPGYPPEFNYDYGTLHQILCEP
ncbi:MAG: hypothetical protein L6461_20935 [Anaerolineae bacterium]|nr:hypothetical protein [Anaerolineae bacterium]